MEQKLKIWVQKNAIVLACVYANLNLGHMAH